MSYCADMNSKLNEVYKNTDIHVVVYILRSKTPST